MSLPVAHAAFSLGWTRSRDWRVLAFLAVVSIAPDFDFALVWGLGLPIREFHRTFSHSLLAAAAATALFCAWRPRWLKALSPWVFFAVLASHSALDMLCTADAADHGVQLFWPLHGARLGWPVLVPLYQWLSPTPFSASGAFLFSVLEIFLAAFLWLFTRALRRRADAWSERLVAFLRPTAPAGPELRAQPQPESD